jgi:hypothetical protein
LKSELGREVVFSPLTTGWQRVVRFMWGEYILRSNFENVNCVLLL